MEHVIASLEESIQDQLLSRSEKKDLKAWITRLNPDQNQMNYIRSKVFDIAEAHANETNYKFVMGWVRDVTNATLSMSPAVHHSISLFSPGEACRDAIIGTINRAVHNIHVCVFTISDDTISEALAEAHRRKVKVVIITDDDKLKDVGSDILRIHQAGVPIRIDNTPNHMHHKFMVADEKIVITGSYNWTRSAAKFNYENILLTYEPGVVKSFLKEFDRLWQVMIPL